MQVHPDRSPHEPALRRAARIERAQPQAHDTTPASWPVRLAMGATFVAALLTSTHSQAAEVYAMAGVPGTIFGIALPASERVGLRADIGGWDRMERAIDREGVAYDARIKATRIGLFADWFVAGGTFRLTGGFTFNDIGAELSVSGPGRQVTFGNTTYTLGADDRFDGRVEMPTFTPYIGLGWGHNPSRTGWGFVGDIGLSLGKPKVSGRASGSIVTSQPQIQDDVQREVLEFQQSIDGIRWFPQITFGASYRW
jgi:hypothetical protein